MVMQGGILMIYVTGHRNPDTDSICAAIACAYLKNCRQSDCAPARLGPLSKETRSILERFGFDAPVLMKDARITLQEIQLDPCPLISENATAFEALALMSTQGIPYVGVADEHGTFTGFVTKTDIGRIGLWDTASAIDLLRGCRCEDFASALEGKIIYDAGSMCLNGKVSILAATDISDYQLKNRIAICGKDPAIQAQAIEKGAGMLIMVWTEKVEEPILQLAKKHGCSLLISGHGAMNTSRYLYFSIPVNQLMSRVLVQFDPEDTVEDALRIMSRYRYRVFPVVKDGMLAGVISPRLAINAKRRQFILVDHNEFAQSVPNIEKAEVLEVIDHHRVADFASRLPLHFHSEPVGSTCTILASMFFDSQIKVPVNYAGLMLAGIVSDTLNFQSPTTTAKDVEMGQRLSQICQVDSDDLANDIFSVNGPLSEEDLTQLVRQDMKKFTIGRYSVLIAQYIMASPQINAAQLQKTIEDFTRTSGADLYVLALTDIVAQGSWFYLAGPLASLLKEQEGFHEGVLSRKRQILPMVSNWLAEL